MVRPTNRAAMPKFLIGALAILLLVACGGAPSEANEANLVRHTIESRFDDQRGDVIVLLPEGYEAQSEKRYPVLYIISDKNPGIEYVREAAGAMPEGMIAVYSNGANKIRLRNVAVSPDADIELYRQHVQSELMPFIDATYRTGPKRFVSAFSRFNGFPAYVLSVSPDLFDGYIFLSPVIGGSLFEDLLAASLKRDFSKPVSLFIHIGADERRRAKETLNKSVSLLETEANTGLRWASHTSPDVGHDRTASALSRGLSFLLEAP